MKWHKGERGEYLDSTGQFRVLRINEHGDEQWQAQERVGQFSQWWSWISTRSTKRECVADIERKRG